MSLFISGGRLGAEQVIDHHQPRREKITHRSVLLPRAFESVSSPLRVFRNSPWLGCELGSQGYGRRPCGEVIPLATPGFVGQRCVRGAEDALGMGAGYSKMSGPVCGGKYRVNMPAHK